MVHIHQGGPSELTLTYVSKIDRGPTTVDRNDSRLAMDCIFVDIEMYREKYITTTYLYVDRTEQITLDSWYIAI